MVCRWQRQLAAENIGIICHEDRKTLETLGCYCSDMAIGNRLILAISSHGSCLHHQKECWYFWLIQPRILGREHEDLTTKVDKQNEVNVCVCVHVCTYMYVRIIWCNAHLHVCAWGIPWQSARFLVWYWKTIKVIKLLGFFQSILGTECGQLVNVYNEIIPQLLSNPVKY